MMKTYLCISVCMAILLSSAGLKAQTDDTFYGQNAGSSNTTGSDNSFFGYNAGSSNSSGSGNSFLGMAAGNVNTTGRMGCRLFQHHGRL